MSSESDSLPDFIQNSAAPAFQGEVQNGERLMCVAGCGQVLIEDYLSDNYISVGIKCFGCGEITRTPALLSGEVFAGLPVSLGEKSSYLLNDTVRMYHNITLTCSQDIKREIETTSPRELEIPLDLKREGLQNLIARYDSVVGNQFSRQQKIVKRLGRKSIEKFPFAWAINHIEECIASGIIHANREETLVALMWLSMFNRVMGLWGHHPRFQIVARDLGKPGSFLHTSSQLIVAAQLFRSGNKIGLSLENKRGEPNPDLYIRGSGSSRIFLEVKAPIALQWNGARQPSAAQIEDTVARQIEKSRKQIDRNHHGVLVIASNHVSEKIGIDLRNSVERVLKTRGQTNRYLAAIALVSTTTMGIEWKADYSVQHNIKLTTDSFLNEHYISENPIRITSITPFR